MSGTTVQMNDGFRLPPIGFGTLRLEEAAASVASALDLGYRLIDTAASYGNEEPVGEGIRRSSVPRDDITVTTKLRGSGHGFDETLIEVEASLKRLGLDRIDLYLIHWPLPRVDRYVDSWKAMIRLREEGVIQSVGVSNFTEAYLRRLIDQTGVTPAVNQIELHPYFPQHRMLAVHQNLGVVTEAWTPLGKGKELLVDERVVAIARKHAVAPGHAVLAWHRSRGVVPIPKAASLEHQRANLDGIDVVLDGDDISVLNGMERGRHFGDLTDPETHEEF